MTFTFAHNNFNVRDLDKSLAFYQEALGLTEVKRVAPADGSFILVYLGDAAGSTHTLELKLLGNRQNCFGPVHDADPTHIYIGPSAWRTGGRNWTNSYRLRQLGLLSAPQLEELP